MREEEEEGDGSISVMSVSRDWTDFAYRMAKALDIKRQYDLVQEFNPEPQQPPRIALHTSDGQEEVSRPGTSVRSAMAQPVPARTICHRRTSATSTAR